MYNSAYYKNGSFQNPLETRVAYNDKMWGALKRGIKRTKGDGIPNIDIKVNTIDASVFKTTPSNDAVIYWLGHSSLLFEVGGKRYLIDPVFSERTSFVQWAGPKRTHPVPIKAADIPFVDAIILSHDHYDHLDYNTILQLKDKTDQFFTPLGLGNTLKEWGITANKITEVDWWQEVKHGNNKLVATPARHYSGRGLTERFTKKYKTHWCSWCFISGEQKIFFSGDSGEMPPFTDIGNKYGPFDATIMPIGAYDEAWPEIHTTPEEAIEAHIQLKGKKLIPIHWFTFDLAMHTWDEPIERLLKEAALKNIEILTPEIGQRLSINNPKTQFWWRK